MVRKRKTTAHRPSQADREFVTNSRGEKVRNTAYTGRRSHTGTGDTSPDGVRGDFSPTTENTIDRVKELEDIAPIAGSLHVKDYTTWYTNPYYDEGDDDDDGYDYMSKYLDYQFDDYFFEEQEKKLQETEKFTFYSTGVLPDEDTRDAMITVSQHVMQDAVKNAEDWSWEDISTIDRHVDKLLGEKGVFGGKNTDEVCVRGLEKIREADQDMIHFRQFLCGVYSSAGAEIDRAIENTDDLDFW